ncbi:MULTISPECIES: hypothetical protein [Acidiphilium]|uniref:Holin-X, holin superfamily III n=1 Tax=Acidiphilium rubrum TaxID=526 RepID=A0A8G2CJJ0_ACIRU|nr:MULTISPECIES: hypothetical protein [Acidiphilium]MBW4035431.1 hypothetical protein [Pseudomonadota bacterium]SIQ53538.1 hypothetical protein SAMN05421828_10614 [Acidiphilium rubrum]
MLRVFFNLIDGFSFRYLTQRIALSLAGLVAGLLGLAFLLAAAFRAVADALGAIDASLIFGAVFIVIALGLFGTASMIWNGRPRPMLARARYGVAAEVLRLAQTLIRKDPSKAVLAALILGAITEYTTKRQSDTRD